MNVLITGGTSGIGLATAQKFISAGHSVLTCGRNTGRIQQTKESLELAAKSFASQNQKPAPRVVVSQIDLADPVACQSLLKTAIDQLQHIDCLINNAAHAVLSPFHETSAEDFDSLVAVNLKAAWQLTQGLWSGMAKNKNGVIISISSMAAVDPFTGFSLYGASKGWVETWTKALADEGSTDGIKVFAVRPGAVETPMLRSLFPEYPPQECVSPTDIADTIFGLACLDTHPSGSIVTVATEQTQN